MKPHLPHSLFRSLMLTAGLTAAGMAAADDETIYLTEGTLDLEDAAVSTPIYATGGELAGMNYYSGSLTIDGDVALSGAMASSVITLKSGSLSFDPMDGSIWTSSALNIEGAFSLGIDYPTYDGYYELILTDSINGDWRNLTVDGIDADDYALTYNNGIIGFTVYSVEGSINAWGEIHDSAVLGYYQQVFEPNLWVDGKITLNNNIYWTARYGRMNGYGWVVGQQFLCSGGRVSERYGLYSGSNDYEIGANLLFRDGSLYATTGAWVFFNGMLQDESIGVWGLSNGNTIVDCTNAQFLTAVPEYIFNGGTIYAPSSTAAMLTLTRGSNTGRNRYIGDLSLPEGAVVNVNITGKSSRPALAVQGQLHLNGGISVYLSTAEATRYVAPHDIILFQSLGFDGWLSDIQMVNPAWRGTLVSAVAGGSSVIAYVLDPQKQTWSTPAKLSGDLTTYIDRTTDSVLQLSDTHLYMEGDLTKELRWSSAKGKGSYELNGSGSLSGENLILAGGKFNASTGKQSNGKATYKLSENIALDYDTITATAGADAWLQGSIAADTTLAVDAGSSSTTQLRVLTADVGDNIRLDYCGGTITAASLSATALNATFGKGISKQNLFNGCLTLADGAVVTVNADTTITRPVLGVTGSLTFGSGVTVNINCPTKQKDFIIFQSPFILGDTPEVHVTGMSGSLYSATVKGYDVLAWVANPTKAKPKTIKLAANTAGTQSLSSAAATTVELGEEGGELLDAYELSSGSYDSVSVRSGIAQLAAGETLSAPVSIGTGYSEFNAALNNSGTINGDVRISANASLDNQGTVNGAVTNAGTLRNDGRISGAVTTLSGATVRGKGSFAGLALADGAILCSSGDTMQVQSLTLSGNTEVQLTVGSGLGAVSYTLLSAESVSGEGTWSLTLSGNSVENAELTWQDGELTFSGTVTEETLQALAAAPAVAETRVSQLAADSLWAVSKMTESFVNNALGQYRDRAGGKTTAYASALGSFVNMSGFTANGGGSAVGVEHNVAEGAALGLSLGYTDSKLKGDGASIDQDSTHLAAYTDLRRGAWGLQAYAAYGNTENTLRGSRDTWDTDDCAAGFTGSWSTEFMGQRLSLFSGLKYAYARMDTAAGRLQQWQLPVGLTLSKQVGKLITSATVAYVGDLARRNPRVKVAGESIRGANPGRSAFELNAGATYLISDRWSASANYALETRARATAQSIGASVRYSF